MKELSASSHTGAASLARRREVSGLTGLRFCAALSVAVSHGTDQILRLRDTPFDFTYWLSQSAGFGMVLFFVLSGFVIHYNYRKAVTQGGLNGLGSFIWARFSRLYPLYFFIVALDVLLGRRLYEFTAGDSGPIRDVLSALPYHLTLTQTWIYKVFSDSSLVYVTGTDAGVTWSIATEWFFYLCYPLVALLVIRIQKPTAAITALVAWCVLWISLAISIFAREPVINQWAATRFGAIASSSYETQELVLSLADVFLSIFAYWGICPWLLHCSYLPACSGSKAKPDRTGFRTDFAHCRYYQHSGLDVSDVCRFLALHQNVEL